MGRFIEADHVGRTYKNPGLVDAAPKGTTYELPPLPDNSSQPPPEQPNLPSAVSTSTTGVPSNDTPTTPDNSTPAATSTTPQQAPAVPQRQSRRLANLAPEYSGLTSLALNDEYLCFLNDFNQLSEHDAFLVGSDLDSKSTPLTRYYDLLR